MHAPHLPPRKVRIGIVGVGNCASSLVQGLSYYREAKSNEPVPGLMNVSVGGYHVRDIELSAAFDVNASKVGKDVADAIWASPNNTHRFAEVARSGVTVRRGRTLDGIGQYLRDDIEISDEEEADVTSTLTQSETDVLVSYLPVGSQQATEWYAERALEAGCGFVNCIPVFIASNPKWRARFENAGLPLVGDDIKSQVGATIVHRILANLFRERGVRLDRTYQLNFGGNADFKNMLERDRLTSGIWARAIEAKDKLAISLIDDAISYAASDFDSGGQSEALASPAFPGVLVVQGPQLLCSQVFTCPVQPPSYPLLADASPPVPEEP